MIMFNIYIYYFLLFKNKKYININKIIYNYNIIIKLHYYNYINTNINKVVIDNFNNINKNTINYYFLSNIIYWGNFFFNKNKYYNTIFLLSNFLSKYLSNYIGAKIDWQFLNISIKKNNKDFLKVWRRTYKKYLLKFFFVSPWYYLYILIRLFFMRDITDFISLFKYSIEKVNIRYHKKFFYYLGFLFRIYYKVLKRCKRIKGFRIYFKGKLGRKGSVRKSTIYIKKGKISFSEKNLKFNYKYFLIPTETGVVGCYFSIFF